MCFLVTCRFCALLNLTRELVLPYTTSVYTVSVKSDTEDVLLDFEFLNDAGSEMLQWTEEIRKLTVEMSPRVLTP